MPTVQTYGHRRVQPAGLPQARLQTPAETEISAGGGLARAKGRAALRIAEGVEAITSPLLAMSLQEITRQKAEERRAADETALLKASNQLSAWQTKRLFDPDTGAFAQRGEAAFPLPEQIHAEYDQVTAAIGTTMATPEQQLAFRKLQASTWQSIDLQVRRHVFTEMQAFREGELTSYVAYQTDSAIRNAGDPLFVEHHLQQAERALRTHLPTLGKGPNAVDEQVHAMRSGGHIGVINQLLTDKKTVQAQDYFTKYSREIAGDKLDDVKKAIEAGTTDAEVLRQADRIVADGGTLSQQLNKAKSLPPEVREPVEQRLRLHDADVQRQQRETEERTLNEAYLIVQRTHNVEAIPPALRNTLGTHLPGLYSFARSLASGVPIETDQPTYVKWWDMAATNPQGFATANLLADRHRLSETDFQELVRLQFRIRTEKPGVQEELVTVRNMTSLFNAIVGQHGLDPNPKAGTPEAEQIARLWTEVKTRLQQRKGNKQETTDTDLAQIVDDLIGAELMREKGYLWWKTTTTAPVIAATIADVPSEERRKIEEALRRASPPIPVTDKAILDVWVATQLNQQRIRRDLQSAPMRPMPSH